MAKSPNKDSFTGRSGQLAVMAEFLIRETNVAIPEVDIGEDIVVVGDDRVRITPVQVKTANAVEAVPEQPDKFDAQFRIPIKQLETSPDLVYAFVVRRKHRWEEFLIVRGTVLNRLRTEFGALSGTSDNQMLRLTFTKDSVMYKGLNFHPFRNLFDPWPPADEIPEGVVDLDAE